MSTEPNLSAPRYIHISRVSNGWLVGVQTQVRTFDCQPDSQYCFTTAESLGKAIENLVTYGTPVVPTQPG